MLAKTKNFDPAVDTMLGCSCGCGRNEVKQWALDKMQLVRDDVSFPMRITSGFRCERHVAEAGKHTPGQHYNGWAFDVEARTAAQRFKLIQAALKHGATGIGVGKTFVHMDWRFGTPAIWSY